MAYVQKLTDLGRDVIAKGQTGLRITFTRVQLGRGEPAPEQIPDMAALVLPVMNCQIVSVARTHVGQWTITAKVPLSAIVADFHLTELGVFAQVGNEPEVLYGVSVVEPGGVPGVISPEMGGGSTAEHTIAIAVTVGTTEEVTAIFDPDIELVNIGMGAGVYADRVGVQFRLRRLMAGEGIQISERADDIRFDVVAVPSGAMVPFAGTFPPQGWLLCDGREYPKAEFPVLAALLGNTFGGGETTFAVPDCRNRTLVGASSTKGLASRGGSETHALTVAQLAAHGHGVTDNGHDHGSWALDPGHSHGVIDAVHGHGTAPHNHIAYFSTNAGSGGPSQATDSWPQYGTAGNWSRDYSVNSGSMIIWEVLAYTSSVVAPINNSWSNISATHAQFTGVRIPNGRANVAIQNAGDGQAFSLMQPYLAINYIIRT